MIRVYEIPDIHFDPAWADHVDRCITAIEQRAEVSPPDLIAIPGDLHNRPLYAADRSGYSRLIDVVRRLLAIAPVVAIEGTPSHDAPGSYAPLEEMGLILLRPGRRYILGDDAGIYDGTTPAPVHPRAVLFGIPELDKDWANTLDADERAGDVLTAFGRYIDDFIAPHRQAFYKLPAIGLLHGVVSDARRENETDIIKRAASLLIHTDTLAAADVDRWVLGDIHTPWESKRISAGYAGFTGMDGNPWGKTGFVPAFNETDIHEGRKVDDKPELGQLGLDIESTLNRAKKDLDYMTGRSVDVRRIPYGAPKRVKITAPLPEYDPAVAYWLDSDTDDPGMNPAKNGGHPWSRITFDPDRKETRRVTKEQADTAASLGDLLALMAPEEITDERRTMADSIDAEKDHTRTERRIRLESVEIAGATFFDGKTVRLDVAALPSGLNAITGDNGAGKSSLLAFCSPYPVVIGKDTESGRTSAIKEFFIGKDSHVEKILTVNGVQHRHLMTIKGAMTKAPKVEAYLYIDGVNVLETTNFDAMFARCEAEYGPMDDYLRTYQYVQPQQGGAPSGLMSAGAVDLRNVVQNIAGIDRTAERRAALDRVADIERQTADAVARIAGMESMLDDVDALRDQYVAAAKRYTDASDRAEETKETARQAAENARGAAETLAAANDAAAKRADHAARIEELERKNADTAERIARLETVDATEARRMLDADEAARVQDRQIREQNAAADREFADARLAYERAANAEAKRKADHDAAVLAVDEQVKRDTSEAARLRDVAKQSRADADIVAEPCEACGHVSEGRAAMRDERIAKAIEAENMAAAIDVGLSAVEYPTPFVPADIGPEPAQPEHVAPPLLATIDQRNAWEAVIREADTAAAILPELRAALESGSAVLADLMASMPAAVDVDGARELNRRYSDALAAANQRAADAEREAMQIDNEAMTIKQRIESAKEKAAIIEKERAENAAAMAALTDWKWLAAMLAPAKLPAFELELVLDSIDERATRNVFPFREGRYQIRTETQREGAAGRVDKFAIQVYDAEAGEERSFLKHSPGEKAFIALAYQRALIATREERIGVSYSPHVLDEADGPVQPARVPEFYAMQTETIGDGRALVVSHAPDAQHYIGNAVAIQELKK